MNASAQRLYQFFFITFFSLLLSGCVPEKGPVIANLSDQPIEILSEYDDGHSILGILESGKVLWAGYAGGEIISLKATYNDSQIYTLEKEELRTALGEDRFTTFIFNNDGFEKMEEKAFFRKIKSNKAD